MPEHNNAESNSTEHLQYTECFCSFLDILGFKVLVKESEAGPERRIQLIHALNELALIKPYRSERRDPSTSAIRCWELRVRVFSDNICLLIPKESGTLSWFLDKVRFVYDQVLLAV